MLPINKQKLIIEKILTQLAELPPFYVSTLKLTVCETSINSGTDTHQYCQRFSIIG